MSDVSAQTMQKALQFFCRHLIGLCVTYRYKNMSPEEADHFASYSGTLFMIDRGVFFLTAGHILKDLEAARSSDDIEITSTVIADTFGPNLICDFPIPFDLTAARIFFIDDNSEGLDLGVIALDPYYVRLLATNGVVALSEENWIHQPRLEFDFYFMLGLPEELASKRVPDSGDAQAAPVMLPVRRLAAPPPDRRPTQHPQFVGQLDQALQLQSVKGMSGGPIIGFKYGAEGVRYWVVALQSSWDPQRRIVYGCSLPILASMMTRWAADARDGQDAA